MDIVVGLVDDIGIDALLDAGINPEDERWSASDTPLATLNLLNIASVAAFLRHLPELGGVDSDIEVAASRFTALPWRQSCVWLPVDLDLSLPQSGETFVGSSLQLRRDLERIATLSPLELGTAPPRYEEMRLDYLGFVRSADIALDRRSTVQWVWRALYDAAQLAIGNTAPMQMS